MTNIIDRLALALAETGEHEYVSHYKDDVHPSIVIDGRWEASELEPALTEHLSPLSSIITVHEPGTLFFREAWADGENSEGIKFEFSRTVGAGSLVLQFGDFGTGYVASIKVTDLVSAWLREAGLKP